MYINTYNNQTFSIKKAFPGMFSTSETPTEKVAVLDPDQTLPEELNEFINFGKDGSTHKGSH